VLKKKKMDVQKLADELIEFRCDDHSIGNVYEWFVKAYGDATEQKQILFGSYQGPCPRAYLRPPPNGLPTNKGTRRSWGILTGIPSL